MPDYADTLIAELDNAPCWPLPREDRIRSLLLERRAFRVGDHDRLAMLAGFDLSRPYVHDSLARRIAFGFADFLFGEDPDITPVNAGDEDLVDDLESENRLPARLHRAERLIVSEGEAWWKLHVELAVADVPLLTWCSRLHVVPLFYGDRALACAFVTERARETVTDVDERGSEYQYERVWRHAEVHTNLRVLNVLYQGTDTELGTRVALEARPETAMFNPQLEHGLPMLAGRVVNDLDDDDCLGVSEYDQVRDELLALDEAITISVENTRLTAIETLLVAGELVKTTGDFDASVQVFRVDSEGEMPTDGKAPPMVQVEKRYDAEPLWLHIGKLVRTILSRVGLVAEFVGDDEQGHEYSGTAIRLRFLPTTNSANGKLREWRHDLPHILSVMLQLAQLATGEGGCGRDVTSTEPPAVEFGDILPRDESQQTIDLSTAVQAEIMSRQVAVEEQHPDWTDEQVQEELQRIRDDIPAPIAPIAPPDEPPPPDPSLPPIAA